MRLDKRMIKLIADLEYVIGDNCYNPNSYDGWNDIYGRNFRYPVNVPNKNGKYTKIRGNINEFVDFMGAYSGIDSLSEESVKYMKYKFGSNELMVGLAIIDLLQFLESRYGISFNQFEDNYMDYKEKVEKKRNG